MDFDKSPEEIRAERIVRWNMVQELDAAAREWRERAERAEARVAELDHTLLLTLKRARQWENRARELEGLCADRL